MASGKTKPAKAKLMETLPALGDAELGEMFVDITNNRLYVRIISGWKYASLT